jgi:hypothetical protein
MRPGMPTTRRADFTFESSVEEGFFTYRYLAHEANLFQGPVYAQAWHEGQRGWRYGGTHDFLGDEDVAVYLGFIWRLISGLPAYAVPRFDRDAGMHGAGEPYALVDWEYDVDWKHMAYGAGWEWRSRFVPAKSCVRDFPPPGPWAKENANRAGLFELLAFRQLSETVRWSDPIDAQLTVYVLRERARAEALVEALQRPEPPSLADCLEPGEILIDLMLDYDYLIDGIAIQTPDDIGTHVKWLAAESRSSIERQRGIRSAAAPEIFEGAVADLLGFEQG